MISIITATYNAALELPNLIDSLRNQTDRDFEWIIIDGASTDETLSLIKGASDVVSKWVSEPDCGIYDAINKALCMIAGDYYLVIGADDTLSQKAIEQYKKTVVNSNADIISTSVFIGDKLKKAGCAWFDFGVSPPCISQHSVGTLIRSNLHETHGLYSLKYPIVADLYFLNTAIESGRSLHITDFVAGRCGERGISSVDRIGAVCEWFRIQIEIDKRVTLAYLSFIYRITKHWLRYMMDRKKSGNKKF